MNPYHEVINVYSFPGDASTFLSYLLYIKPTNYSFYFLKCIKMRIFYKNLRTLWRKF